MLQIGTSHKKNNFFQVWYLCRTSAPPFNPRALHGHTTENVVIGLNSHKTGTLHHISPEALQFDTLVAITALILFFQRFFELCHKSADRSKNFLWITALRLTKRNLLRQE